MGMVIGETLMRLTGVANYSPTFGRGGLAAQFACEVLDLAGPSVAFNITVQHKNAEDIAFTTLGTFASITAAGVEPLNATGIKEQLRFKYEIGGTAPTNAVHFNMLSPAWRPY